MPRVLRFYYASVHRSTRPYTVALASVHRSGRSRRSAWKYPKLGVTFAVCGAYMWADTTHSAVSSENEACRFSNTKAVTHTSASRLFSSLLSTPRAPSRLFCSTHLVLQPDVQKSRSRAAARRGARARRNRAKGYSGALPLKVVFLGMVRTHKGHSVGALERF